MKYIPRNVRLAYKHAGLTHFGAPTSFTNLYECCNFVILLLGTWPISGALASSSKVEATGRLKLL